MNWAWPVERRFAQLPASDLALIGIWRHRRQQSADYLVAACVSNGALHALWRPWGFCWAGWMCCTLPSASGALWSCVRPGARWTEAPWPPILWPTACRPRNGRGSGPDKGHAQTRTGPQPGLAADAGLSPPIFPMDGGRNKCLQASARLGKINNRGEAVSRTEWNRKEQAWQW